MAKSINISRIETIAQALAPVTDEIVFTGGATVEFYLQRPLNRGLRETKDVDCIVQVITRAKYHAFEKKIQALGFTPAQLKGHRGPICRYLFQDIFVDFMPLDKDVLGFNNSWFPQAAQNTEEIILSSRTKIRIPDFPHFLAIKFEAMLDRGAKDLRVSPDLEDIITVLDHRTAEEPTLVDAPNDLITYLSGTMRDKLHQRDFREAVLACSPEGFEQGERVLAKMTELSLLSE